MAAMPSGEGGIASGVLAMDRRPRRGGAARVGGAVFQAALPGSAHAGVAEPATPPRSPRARPGDRDRRRSATALTWLLVRARPTPPTPPEARARPPPAPPPLPPLRLRDRVGPDGRCGWSARDQGVPYRCPRAARPGAAADTEAAASRRSSITSPSSPEVGLRPVPRGEVEQARGRPRRRAGSATRTARRCSRSARWSGSSGNRRRHRSLELLGLRIVELDLAGDRRVGVVASVGDELDHQ